MTTSIKNLLSKEASIETSEKSLIGPLIDSIYPSLVFRFGFLSATKFCLANFLGCGLEVILSKSIILSQVFELFDLKNSAICEARCNTQLARIDESQSKFDIIGNNFNSINQVIN